MELGQLKSEFIPELNPGVEFGSIAHNQKVIWRCYKNRVHVWETTLSARRACPYCCNRKLSPDGSNTFAALHPLLATEWHPTKNPKTSAQVAGVGGFNVHWMCQFGHEWEATPNTRVSMKTGCPYCSGKRVSSENSMDTVPPEISQEWNDPRPISDFSIGSHYKAQWKCNEGHVWTAMVQDRALKGRGCPYCSGRTVCHTNSLATLKPEIAKEWHPTKNLFTPDSATTGSSKKGWWVCPSGHEWEAKITDRIGKGSGCPTCASSYPGLEKKAEEILGLLRFNRFPFETRAELPYKPDFKLSDTLFLNTDGLYWHSEECRERSYHLKMREDFSAKGFRLLQFYEDEVLNKPEIIKSMVDATLGRCSNRIFARKCSVSSVEKEVADVFLAENHIIGPVPISKHLGLFLDGELIQVMSTRKTGSTLEITRSCSKLGIIVVGGFSKLLSHTTQDPSLKNVVTHIDLRYADGHSLKKMGFQSEGIFIDYQYSKGKERKDKRAFRVPAGQDERILAKEQGWVRIFNAGRARYRLNLGKTNAN
jgi:hypothetical protein